MTSKSRAALVQSIEQQITSVVLDQPDAIRLVLAAVLSGGHVLIEDRPGVGKTTLAKALASSLGLDMRRVQGTSDLLPSDITGIHVFDPSTRRWIFEAGPVTASVVLVDELNRATPKAQSALLEAMAEGQISVNGETMPLPDPHIVVATQNPWGELGTHRLGAAQLDRFAIVVSLGRASRSTEEQLLRIATSGSADLAPILSAAELRTVRSEIGELTVGDPVLGFVLDIVDHVRDRADDVWLSSRVPLDLLSTARGHAFVCGRSYVAPDDVRAVAGPTMHHRVGTTLSSAELDEVVRAVPLPRVDSGP